MTPEFRVERSLIDTIIDSPTWVVVRRTTESEDGRLVWRENEVAGPFHHRSRAESACRHLRDAEA